MLGGGKLVGGLLIALGVGLFVIVAVFVGIGLSSGQVGPAGAGLGIGLFGCVPLLLLGGFGIFMVLSGRKDEAQQEQVAKKQRILGMIQAQGQVSLSEIMLEMELDRDQVTIAIYELVTLGLFSGYVDWDALIFYSQDAAAVATNACPNCGGIRELVSKGVVKCPYCGVSLFVPPNAEQTQAEPKPPPVTEEDNE